MYAPRRGRGSAHEQRRSAQAATSGQQHGGMTAGDDGNEGVGARRNGLAGMVNRIRQEAAALESSESK